MTTGSWLGARSVACTGPVVTAATVPVLPLLAVACAPAVVEICVVRGVVRPLDVELELDPQAATARLRTRLAMADLAGRTGL